MKLKVNLIHISISMDSVAIDGVSINFAKIVEIMEQIFAICEDNDSIYFYGAALEQLITNKPVTDPLICMLHVDLLPKIDQILIDIQGEIIRKYRMYSIHDINICNFSNNTPNYWQVRVQPDFTIIFHCMDAQKVVFDCDNLMINKAGFCIFDMCMNIDYKYPFSMILHNLHNIHTHQCNVMSIHNLHLLRENTHDLFNIINEQNTLIKRGKTINRGFVTVLDENELCSICYNPNDAQLDTYLYILECKHIFCSNCIEKHMCSFQLINCKNCPICRQKIVFQVK